MSNEIEKLKEITNSAMNNWRITRDNLFDHYGISEDKYYSDVDQKIPSDLLKAVCYIDAFRCVKEWIEDINE